LFLTFDDGPHPQHTPDLLQLLARHGAQASFFMLGQSVRQHREVARQVHAAGHRLANHSTTHPWFNRIGWRQQREEIAETEELLGAIDGSARHLFRPPHGRVSVACLLRALAGTLPTTLWTTDSLDYRLGAADVIARLRSGGVRGGDILLFHDDATIAAEALDVLLPEWCAQGLRCVALPDPGHS
jgi:peptidoglycan/xylan/chitin deacetylase (PgdA/CDA1 family)